MALTYHNELVLYPFLCQFIGTMLNFDVEAESKCGKDFNAEWISVCQIFYQTRMHSSRMRTARSSSGREGFPLGSPPGPGPPGTRPPPGPGIPPGSRPPDQAPPPRTEFLTHAYENITLPQTSFAGGKDLKESRGMDRLKSCFKRCLQTVHRHLHSCKLAQP